MCNNFQFLLCYKLTFDGFYEVAAINEIEWKKEIGYGGYIQLLIEKFKGAHVVLQVKADADSLIVKQTIEEAEKSDAVLIGDDTDLLVLLLYHAKMESHDIYFAPDYRSSSTRRVWDIKQTKRELGPNVCEHILFLHAFLGCDTTSRLFGVGKGAIIKKFKSNASLLRSAEIFNSVESSHKAIETAGEKVLVAVYNGKDESHNSLRHKKFIEKLATSTSHIEPKNLPPTAAAAKFHSYRIFLQICQWKDLACDLEPSLWGWAQTVGGLFPITTDLPPAPEDLLKIIRCNCTTDCSSGSCSCQKYGMKCSLACG